MLVMALLATWGTIRADESAAIYVVGDMNEWVTPTPDNAEALSNYRLYETTPGSNIYEGYISTLVMAGTGRMADHFKIYTELDETKAIGSAVGETAVEFPASEIGMCEMSYVSGSGSAVANFAIPDGSSYCPYISVDMNRSTITFDQMNRYFIVGELSGNVAPTLDNVEHYKNWMLKWYQTQMIDIPAGKFSFYLVDRLGNKAGTYGASTNTVSFDENGNTRLSSTLGDSTPWTVADWQGGKVAMFMQGDGTLDITDYDDKIYLFGTHNNYANWTTANADQYADWILTETYDGSRVYQGTFEIPAQSGSSDLILRFIDRLTENGWYDGIYNTNQIGLTSDLAEVNFNEYGFTHMDLRIGTENCMVVKNWTGGTLSFVVDLNKMSVIVDKQSCYYLIGDISGNIAPTYENLDKLAPYAVNIGTAKVFDIPAGDVSFYFSTLGGSVYKARSGAENIEFDENGFWEGRKTTGSNGVDWKLSDWEGGKIVVNLYGQLRLRKLGTASQIYMVGSMNNWESPTDDTWALKETTAGSGIYKGTFNIEASSAVYFKFWFSVNDGWNDDNTISISTSPFFFGADGTATSEVTIGGAGNNAEITNWNGGEIEFTVDMNTMTLTVNVGEENATKYLYLMGVSDVEPIPANAEDYADWMILESTTDGIYSGTFYVPADKFSLYFSPKFTDEGWNTAAYYAGTEDIDLVSNLDETATGTFDLTQATTGGRWTISDWEGGDVAVTINLNENTVKFSVPSLAPKQLYVIGQFTNWVVPSAANTAHYANYALRETTIGSNIYKGTFYISSGSAQFRFYTELSGWEVGALGCQAYDNPIDYQMTEGQFSGTLVDGKGTWNFPDWAGGNMNMTVDLNNYTVFFEDPTISALDDALISHETIQPGVGQVSVSGADRVTIYNTMGILLADIQADDTTITIDLPAGLYIVNGKKVIIR